MTGLPDFLKVPVAVAGFRARIAVQQSHQEVTFNGMLSARPKYEAASAVVGAWPPEEYYGLPDREDMKEALWEMAAYQSLYEDLGATLILLAAASVERLYNSVGLSLFKRGAASYAAGVTFIQAIHSLANQYKHLGEWLRNGPRSEADMQVVTKLVENALRTDAASEFIKRCCFKSYNEFEAALLSCSDGLADPSLIPNGKRGLPTVSIVAVAPKHN